MTVAFFHGFVLGFGLILPLGPQNTFVLTQGAAHARLARAMPAVAVAALCDTALIVIAVLGVSLVVLTFAWVKTALLLAGVGFLVVFGVLLWRGAASAEGGEAGSDRWPLRRQVAFAASVSLLNPHAILDTTGVIGTSSLSYAGDERVAFTIAAILVSWMWFLTLAVAGRLLMAVPGMRGILNRVSAGIMWATAAYLATDLAKVLSL